MLVNGFIACFYSQYDLGTWSDTPSYLVYLGVNLTVGSLFLKFIFSQIDSYLKTDLSVAEKLRKRTGIHGTLVATACAIGGGFLIPHFTFDSGRVGMQFAPSP